MRREPRYFVTAVGCGPYNELQLATHDDDRQDFPVPFLDILGGARVAEGEETLRQLHKALGFLLRDVDEMRKEREVR